LRIGFIVYGGDVFRGKVFEGLMWVGVGGPMYFLWCVDGSGSGRVGIYIK